jgi:uncharacterized membrane protein YhiD involved in acid resistance
VIGNSLARAFSLAGVLAIIRFRTIIDDTRDTAFVIASVAMGLAAGAGFYQVAWVTLPFIGITTWLFRTPRTARKGTEILEIRLLATEDPSTVIEPILKAKMVQVNLVSVDKNGKGTHQDLEYAVKPKENVTVSEVIDELRKLASVQRIRTKPNRDRG